MNPVAVIQHTAIGAPGAIAEVLSRLQLPFEVLRICDGDPVPERAGRWGGLVLLGGSMSVHDPLPWIGKELALIRQALAQRIPVVGHCLGSQLLALAIGGSVRASRRKEIGWNQVTVAANSAAARWFGRPAGTRMQVFQWHGETFELPAGAAPIASGEHCRNQGFVVDDLHLGIQFHLEMTVEMVEAWVAGKGAELDREFASGNPAVTSRRDTLADLGARTASMHATLHDLYARWARTLRP